jgi:hypothetical protein
VRSSRLKAGLILAGVFVLGLAAGGAGMYALVLRELRTIVVPNQPDESALRFRLWLVAKGLDLDRDQRDQLDAIVREDMPEYQRIRAKVEPDMQALRDKQLPKIRAMLRPEQVDRFDRIVADVEKARKDQGSSKTP